MRIRTSPEHGFKAPLFSIVMVTYARDHLVPETIAQAAKVAASRLDEVEFVLVDNNADETDRSSFLIATRGTLDDAGRSAALADYLARLVRSFAILRENQDLVIKGGTRFLVVRRDGPDAFRVAENVTVPSTSLVDFGAGTVRTLDELIDDISSLPN